MFYNLKYILLITFILFSWLFIPSLLEVIL